MTNRNELLNTLLYNLRRLLIILSPSSSLLLLLFIIVLRPSTSQRLIYDFFFLIHIQVCAYGCAVADLVVFTNLYIFFIVHLIFSVPPADYVDIR